MSAPLIRDPKYIDLLVVNGAWQLDAGGQPRYTQDRHSIGQDIKHRIMESGLARKLI
ncbi:phage protein, partial [Aeromonas salmonicida subsp. salmonicida 01-B526]